MREYERVKEDVEDEAELRVRSKVQQIKHEQKMNEREIEEVRAACADMVRKAKLEFESKLDEIRSNARDN